MYANATKSNAMRVIPNSISRATFRSHVVNVTFKSLININTLDWV